MKDLYLIGAGSVGGHVACNLQQYTSGYTLRGFFDDDPQKIGTSFCGHPVLGPVIDILDQKDVAVFIGIAFPRIKQKIVELISQNPALEFPSFISPAAWISTKVMIGQGSLIYPGCSINYGSHIGNYVVMNMNCAIGHDCRIGDFSSLAPGVNFGGHTHIDSGVDIGIGTSTLQQIKVGKGAVIGGQTMLTRDVEPWSKIVGVPGKTIPF